MMFKKSVYILFFVLISIFTNINAQINVACIGNSITQGGNIANYPAQLEIHLGNNYVVKNYGTGGRTLLQNTALPYIESIQHAYSIATPHDIVIILLGTNDSDEDVWVENAHFKEDYYDLIEDYKNYPGHDDPVFILGLPPPVFNESLGPRNAPIVNKIIPMIKQVANELNLTLANFYNALDGKPELFTDGVHPNYAGAEIMAEVAYNAIQNSMHVSDPPPETPTGLKTISGVLDITLKWNANPEDDLFSYTIFRSYEKGGVQAWMGITLKPDTTFSDSNVDLNHIYYYSIDAIDIHDNVSKRTAAVLGKTLDLEPPSAPLNLQVILEADSVKTIWTPNSEPDIEKYHIYRNTILNDIQQSSSIIGTVYAPDSNFLDINYASATNYYYGIKALDISGNQGSISNIVNVTTKSRPLSSDTTLTFYEDIPHQFLASNFPFTDADNHTLDKIIFIDSDYLEYFTYDNDTINSPFICDDISKLLFSPKLDEFGYDYANFSFKVIDSFGSTSLDTNMIVINLAPVNDIPFVNPISDLYLMEDSHNLLLPITGINAGPANETQNLSVKVFTDFVNVSDIQYSSPEDTGLVIIDPVENVFGIIPVTIQIEDDGGTINGGIDTFSTTFNIHIAAVNDPPILNFTEIEISEDLEIAVELTGIQPGPGETDQQILMSVKSNNTDILPHPVLIYNNPDTTATLTLSTIPNIFGTTSITIYMTDDGGTEFGGKDSTTYIIPVEIISINDKPADFNMITPLSDSTIVINKSNYLNTFLISWDASSDIENDLVLYDIIFDTDFSTLSRYGIISTNTEYILKEFLSVSDTVSITTGTFSVIATDGDLETTAINHDIALNIDGRSFAPPTLHLDQNYPNPFNNTTVIGFDLPKTVNVSITIFDLLGVEIIKLINNKKYERGYNTITWNGLDKNNNLISAGVYIMQVRMGSQEKHKKLILLK